MADKIREIEASQFNKEVLEKKGGIVLDFYSTECPPCEALAAKYESLSEIYGDDITFLKVFRQGNRELAESLGVTGSPTVLFFKDGKETGERLTGGIKRADLQSKLEALLPAEREAELRDSIKPVRTECDVIVIGGGPAGLTAGIYLAQAHIKTILVDVALPGGYVSTTHQVSNYPGFVEPQAGMMLAHFISEQTRAAGVDYRVAVDVTAVDLENKTVTVDGYETIKAKKIIIATGSSPRPLGLKGELEYRGNGISYCATCDGKYYQDKEIVVIGGGNSAIEESLFLAKFAKKITVVHQFAELQANKLAQEQIFAEEKVNFLFEHEPREFRKNGTMDMEVVVENLRTKEYYSLKTNGVFVFVGFIPNLDGFKDDLALDEWGYIKTDDVMRTNVPDVYAAGDVTSKLFRQITTAAADGTIAAMTISKELQ
jgi:thioredoxin reductase (NADPH)